MVTLARSATNRPRHRFFAVLMLVTVVGVPVLDSVFHALPFLYGDAPPAGLSHAHTNPAGDSGPGSDLDIACVTCASGFNLFAAPAVELPSPPPVLKPRPFNTPEPVLSLFVGTPVNPARAPPAC